MRLPSMGQSFMVRCLCKKVILITTSSGIDHVYKCNPLLRAGLEVSGGRAAGRRRGSVEISFGNVTPCLKLYLDFGGSESVMGVLLLTAVNKSRDAPLQLSQMGAVCPYNIS